MTNSRAVVYAENFAAKNLLYFLSTESNLLARSDETGCFVFAIEINNDLGVHSVTKNQSCSLGYSRDESWVVCEKYCRKSRLAQATEQ
ncbi:hypothetical protein [Pseudomonas sp. IT-P253]|jgi:hypothetical protein|uniref:hypothetical protein n=1 Tax=Pseudomonas sp. IT-P253 TaxID=3026455 RepID=UPI0039E02D3A